VIDSRVAELTAEAGLSCDGDVTIEGNDPVLAAKFPIGEAAATALGACAAAAAHLHALRTGETQSVSVDVTNAAASLISFGLQSVDGKVTRREAEGNPLVALYECGDGRWIHIHGAFPRLADPTLDVLQCAPDRDSIAAAVKKWDAQDLEDALAERRTCGAKVRTAAEWREHAQGVALAGVPRVELVRIGDAPPEPLKPGARPLEGVRVLDLTRMLAGPACGRLLAEHGADVLAITGRDLPNPLPFVIDTGHGKRTAFLELHDAGDAQRLRMLASKTDVFIQGYRTGAMARRGFAPEDLAALRPGIVYVSINCYGHEGPFVQRPGWEQLAQSVAGIAAVEGAEDRPQLLPAAACDYTTGYLAALGTLAAIAKRSTEGGSWHVRASLARTAMWFDDLGPRCDPAGASGLAPATESMLETQTGYGVVRHLGPVARLSATSARWDLPTAPLGSHEPVWN
jgi:crotonobetainyl-CoA:carnitine CoA-transferase CaiB-like acyl-CoA transferase